MQSILRLTVAVLLAASAIEAEAQQTRSYTPSHTMIPNVQASTSFLRLYGGGLTPTDFEIKTFGTVTGRLYQTKTVTVQGGDTRQLNPNELITVAPDPRDTVLHLEVQGKRSNLSGVAGLYQHVRFDHVKHVIENMSECAFNLTAYDLGYYRDYYIRQGRFLPFVHTSHLTGYTSFLSISNPDSVNRWFRVSALGMGEDRTPNVPISEAPQNYEVPARGTLKLAVPMIEQRARWNFPNSQIHVNLTVAQITMPNEVPYEDTAIITHSVRDDASQVETSLAQYCPVEGVSTGKPDTGPAADAAANINTAGFIDGDFSASAGPGSGGYADASIFPAGDVDWYRVTLERGAVYTIYTTPGSNNGGDALYKVRVRLLNSSGAVVPLRTWEAGRKGNELVYVSNSGGVHFVEVDAADGKSTGGYQVVVNNVYKANPCDPLDASLLYVTENSCNPNAGVDFSADADTPGVLCVRCDATGYNELDTPADKDWHKVYLAAGSTYSVVLNPVSDGTTRGLNDVTLKLINTALGTSVRATAENDYDDVTPPRKPPTKADPTCTFECVMIEFPEPAKVYAYKPAVLKYTVPQSGFYYVEVSSKDGSSFGTYNLVVTKN